MTHCFRENHRFSKITYFIMSSLGVIQTLATAVTWLFPAGFMAYFKGKDSWQTSCRSEIQHILLSHPEGRICPFLLLINVFTMSYNTQ